MTVTRDSDNLPARPTSAPTPGRLGQATAVEQSRAMAQVHAQVVTAQQVPRLLTAARDDLLLSCAQPAVAERAFYRYRRGSANVSGPTIQLAREMARCFRNIDYGIAELHRDDDEGMSEMMAFAWDLEANTRASTTFFVPHRRYTDGTVLVDLRDVYENNASQGGRRVREMILAVLPPWFVEDATTECQRTLERGDGRPLAERVDAAVAAFAKLDVTVAALEAKLGRGRDRWTAGDLAHLSIIRRSLNRRETTVEDEFGARTVTADELTGAQGRPQAAAAGSDSPNTADPPSERRPGDESIESGDSDGSPPPEMTADELRARVKAAGVTLTAVREMLESETGRKWKGTGLDWIVADAEILALVLDWVDQVGGE